MPLYDVTVPIAGYAVVRVRANSEQEAVDAAINSDQLTTDAIEEWDGYTRLVEGNVMRVATPWKASAEEVGE